MRVRLRFFAMLREKVGAEVVRDARPGASVGAVWRAFVKDHPELARVRVRFAVREEYVEAGYRPKDGDEVAVFPPVSGGAHASTTRGGPRSSSSVAGSTLTTNGRRCLYAMVNPTRLTARSSRPTTR